ncbi:hypothetical protein TUM17576_21130 [Enterobacter hormaechei]|nr:hypothetical protein TUM17576_21130 [Enterobacter hormaechei]
MPADNFISFVTCSIEEIIISLKHDTLRGKRYDSHRTANGIYSGLLLKCGLHTLRNIGRNFDDSFHPATSVYNREVAGFKPYGAIFFRQAKTFTAKAFAKGKALPEPGVLRCADQ